MLPLQSLIGSLTVTTKNNQDSARFSVGLRHKGFLHQFANHKRAKMERLNITDDSVEWVVKSNKKTLEIKANRGKEAILFSGSEEGFTNRIKQTLLSEIDITLKEGNTTILRDNGRCAAIEQSGPVDRLIETQRPK